MDLRADVSTEEMPMAKEQGRHRMHRESRETQPRAWEAGRQKLLVRAVLTGQSSHPPWVSVSV